MQYKFSLVFAFLYKKIIKNLLFLLSADKAHALMLNMGQLLGFLPPVRWFFKWIWRYDNANYLAQVIHNVYFANPIGLSAGFDKDFKTFRILPYVGFGFAEGGSITKHASSGNPRPHYRRLKKSESILVYAGLRNLGVNINLQRIKFLVAKRRLWMPYIISVAKTNSPSTVTEQSGIEDYMASLKKIIQAGVGEFITINISCPNAYGGEPFTTPNKLDRLLNEVSKIKFNKPIFLKMPIDQPWPEYKKLLEVAIKYQITGVTIGNLAKDRDKANLQDPLDSNIPGNMSGKPTHDLSNELIRQTYQFYGDKLLIIGAGGVFSGADAYKKIKLGATLIELITGMIFEGPQLIGQINHDLVKLLKKDGYIHISQAIGASHRK